MLRTRTAGSGWRSAPLAIVSGAALVALVTVVIHLLRSSLEVLSPASLYIFAVLPARALWGLVHAVPVALASMLTYAWLFLPPVHGFAGKQEGHWFEMAVVACVLLGVSELAARARGRAGVSEEARGRLADEQASLRRVATLVARGVSPEEVFAAVAEEVAGIVGADTTSIVRKESDESVTLVAHWGPAEAAELPVDDRIVRLVLESGRPGRTGGGGIGVDAQGVSSTVGSPIVVEGRIWGAVFASSTKPEELAGDTEARIAGFTELVGTAISNAESRTELAASRSRIVATADETRRRIERDLHDGTQQRLVSLALGFRAAAQTVPAELGELRTRLDQLTDGLAGALDELRELSHGIHPAILSEGGLMPALRTLARRSAVPVELDLGTDGVTIPDQIEVTAYYVVSEALANAAKHAQASSVRVEVQVEDHNLLLTVRDDGLGGADPARGTGLVGLTDRIDAAGGTMTISSPPGRGTTLHAALPLPAG